jgi:hypothetical protein
MSHAATCRRKQVRVRVCACRQTSACCNANTVVHRLTSLPDEIVGLTRLRKLYASGNQLNELPSGLALLPQLETIRCEHNPLRKPPVEVVRRGPLALRRYV